jgi:hypothetical protein
MYKKQNFKNLALRQIFFILILRRGVVPRTGGGGMPLPCGGADEIKRQRKSSRGRVRQKFQTDK